jgi:DNA-directed RNA polymerase specialized sigma24 family protein
MSSESSVTHWVRKLELGDEEAARQLFGRYFRRLVDLAQRRLAASDRRVSDEEDVALTVFRCLCDGAKRGQLAHVTSRDDLWRLLIVITSHKVIDQKRHAAGQKRGGGRVRGGAASQQGDNSRSTDPWRLIVDDEPTPDTLCMLAEEHQRLMTLLPDERFRRIAALKLEGYTNDEIAAHVGLTRRSIERKLQRIRLEWIGEVER